MSNQSIVNQNVTKRLIKIVTIVTIGKTYTDAAVFHNQYANTILDGTFALMSRGRTRYV